MPFRHNVIRQRQPQPRALPGRFGGEKRLEDFGFHVFGDTRASLRRFFQHIFLDADFPDLVVVCKPNGAIRRLGKVFCKQRIAFVF